MKAAWYEKQGKASEVLEVGEMGRPVADAGEVLIRLAASGVNPGDVKKRDDAFGVGMAYPRVVPQSDGAGIIESVGKGVSNTRVGERVWCYGAQSYRPFGTAAEYTSVPSSQAVKLPSTCSFVQGALLGIPGITGHRAVFANGPVSGKTVLVQGAAGAVGGYAAAIARHFGARVIGTVRSEPDAEKAKFYCDHIVDSKQLDPNQVVNAVLESAPDGVDHVVEVAFHANIEIDEKVLKTKGSIAAFATGDPNPKIPFWQLLFKNVSIYLLGSDDFTSEEKQQASSDLNEMLSNGTVFEPVDAYSIDEIVAAHEAVEAGSRKGRVVISI